MHLNLYLEKRCVESRKDRKEVVNQNKDIFSKTERFTDSRIDHQKAEMFQKPE